MEIINLPTSLVSAMCARALVNAGVFKDSHFNAGAGKWEFTTRKGHKRMTCQQVIDEAKRRRLSIDGDDA